jgi:hypothetical protein
MRHLSEVQVARAVAQWRLVTFGLGSATEPKSIHIHIHGVTEKSAFILTSNNTYQLQQLFQIKFLGISKNELTFVSVLF